MQPSPHRYVFRNRSNVLVAPDFEQTQRVQRAHNVFDFDRRLHRDVLQAAPAVRFSQRLHDHKRPKPAIADSTQIRQRLLRRPDLLSTNLRDFTLFSSLESS